MPKENEIAGAVDSLSEADIRIILELLAHLTAMQSWARNHTSALEVIPVTMQDLDVCIRQSRQHLRSRVHSKMYGKGLTEASASDKEMDDEEDEVYIESDSDEE